MTKLLVAVFAALALAFLLLRSPRAGTRVDGAEARRLVSDGAVLLDVREPEEFAAGHLEGAINIPVDELGSRVGELGAKDRAVVVYCRSGRRSADALGTLKAAGFAGAVDLGPMSAW